jgi:pyruvate, water dikinase
VILIDEFCELFDGFSIGSNDLTQLTLGADRDNARLAALSFDESDPGMLKSFKMAIEGAHAKGLPIGICGEAPSDDVEVARYLVEQDIDSMSLSTSSFLKTSALIGKFERQHEK